MCSTGSRVFIFAGNLSCKLQLVFHFNFGLVWFKLSIPRILHLSLKSKYVRIGGIRKGGNKMIK